MEEESQHLAMLGDFIGKKISLQVENAYHQEQYDRSLSRVSAMPFYRRRTLRSCKETLQPAKAK